MAQVEKRWINPPGPLDSDGNVPDRPIGRINLVFRFGDPQAGKLRGFGDFKDSLANST